MKTAIALAAMTLLAWFGGTAQTEQDLIAEMEKCAVCKAVAENPSLMREMTWETHKIDNGMLCLTTVPKEHAKEFVALHEKMLKNVAQVEADQKKGVNVELCSFCQAVSELEKAGAKQEFVQTGFGGINLLTSSDPSVVEKIHAQADKAIAEQTKLKEAKKESSQSK